MTSLGVEYGCVYTLTGPDGTVAVFNDSTDKDFVGSLSPESSGLDSPDVREDATDATEEDGGVHGNFYYGRRPVVLQGTIIASSATDRNAKVERLLRASNAMRVDATLKWKPQGATEEVELKLRRQQPARVTKGYVKDFQLAMVSAAASINGASLIEKSKTYAPDATTGFKSPQAASGEAGSGNEWKNPTNIFASDNVRSTAEALSFFSETRQLIAEKFALEIPVSAIPIVAKLKVERRTTVATSVNDQVIRLEYPAKTGINKASATQWPTTEAVAEYAYDIKEWRAEPWTVAEMNSASFKVNLIAKKTTNVGAPEVDNIQLAVEYMLGPHAVEPENIGNADADVEITVVGPIVNPKVENATTGDALVFNLELTAGQELKINTSARTIKLGGENKYSALDFASSVWFKLVPGKNNVVLTGTGQANGSTKLVTAHRSAWI